MMVVDVNLLTFHSPSPERRKLEAKNGVKEGEPITDSTPYLPSLFLAEF